MIDSPLLITIHILITNHHFKTYLEAWVGTPKWFLDLRPLAYLPTHPLPQPFLVVLQS